MTVSVLTGTVEFDTSGSRVLDIPAVSSFEVGGAPVPFLSRVGPDDPADLGLFKLLAVGSISPSGAQPGSYLGARTLTITYELTGGSPIDVRFYLVWDSEVNYTELAYNGS